MNYIRAYKDHITEVESRNNANLEFALKDAIYLAKDLQGTVSLKHQLGEYLIDRWGSVEVIIGQEPNRDLLPTIIRTS